MHLVMQVTRLNEYYTSFSPTNLHSLTEISHATVQW